MRCIVHSGAVLGADGFGIAHTSDGWLKVPQLGGVEIGDDCEIGANTTIDRGAIDNTQIGDDVKLDIVRVEPEGSLTARLEPRKAGGTGSVHVYPLIVEVPPGAPLVDHMSSDKKGAGKVIIKTGHPDMDEITIYVRFAVQ